MLACGDDGKDGSVGDDSASADSLATAGTTEGDTATGTNGSAGEDGTPESACRSMCVTDIGCDPMHEPWTVEECTMLCLSDLDTDGGPCKPEYVELWACVGDLSCEQYLDWVYGDPPLPCPDRVDAIEACENGGKSGASSG